MLRYIEGFDGLVSDTPGNDINGYNINNTNAYLAICAYLNFAHVEYPTMNTWHSPYSFISGYRGGHALQVNISEDGIQRVCALRSYDTPFSFSSTGTMSFGFRYKQRPNWLSYQNIIVGLDDGSRNFSATAFNDTSLWPIFGIHVITPAVFITFSTAVTGSSSTPYYSEVLASNYSYLNDWHYIDVSLSYMSGTVWSPYYRTTTYADGNIVSIGSLHFPSGSIFPGVCNKLLFHYRYSGDIETGEEIAIDDIYITDNNPLDVYNRPTTLTGVIPNAYRHTIKTIKPTGDVRTDWFCSRIGSHASLMTLPYYSGSAYGYGYIAATGTGITEEYNFSDLEQASDGKHIIGNICGISLNPSMGAISARTVTPIVNHSSMLNSSIYVNSDMTTGRIIEKNPSGINSPWNPGTINNLMAGISI